MGSATEISLSKQHFSQGLEAVKNSGGHIPLLAKEGWPRHQKMVPFRKGADGVVARE